MIASAGEESFQRSFSVSILIVYICHLHVCLVQSCLGLLSVLSRCSHFHCCDRTVRSRAYICSSRSGSTRPPWTRSNTSYLDQHPVTSRDRKLSDLTKAFVEAESFLLTVELSLLTLAVVTLTVTPLHHTPRPCPVMTPGPLDDRLVVLQAQSLRPVVWCVDNESLC